MPLSNVAFLCVTLMIYFTGLWAFARWVEANLSTDGQTAIFSGVALLFAALGMAVSFFFRKQARVSLPQTPQALSRNGFGEAASPH